MEKPTIIRYAAGTLCIALGFVPIIMGYNSWSETGPFEWFFYAVSIILFSWFGIQALLDSSRMNLNRCVAMIMIFGAIFLLNAVLGAISPSDDYDEINSGFSLFFVTLISIFLHVVMMKFLTRWSGMESPQVRDLIGRGVLIFLAFQIFHILTKVVDMHWTEEGERGLPRTGVIIIPIFLAIGFYQWAKCLVGIRKVPTKPFTINLEDSK